MLVHLLLGICPHLVPVEGTRPEEIEAGPIIETETGDRLEEYLSRLEGHGFSGVVLVARGPRVLLARGYGHANREGGVPADTRTVISTGSITKQYTGAAILKLAEAGRLSVRDSIAKHLPDVPEDKSAITLHHLLTHGSGLRSNFAESDFSPVGREEYVRRALSSELLFEPGAGFHYSNAGYSLLAAIIERLSGRSYEAFVREQLFAPLGMEHTGYVLPEWDPAHVAHGYTEEGHWGTILERPMGDDGPYWALRGNGGVHTTLADVWRWHRGLESDAVLSAASRAELMRGHVSEGGGNWRYGYGWSVAPTPRGTRLVTHDGSNGVFFADFRRYVDEGVLIYVASNARPHAGAVRDNLARIVFEGSLPDLPPEVVELDADALAELAGTYATEEGAVHVEPDAGGLSLAPDGPGAFALVFGPQRGYATELGERALRALEDSLAEDYEALHRAFGGEMPLQQVAARQAALWDRLIGEHGDLRALDLLGSAPSSMGTASYVRVELDRATVYFVLGWEGGRVGLFQVLDEAPRRRLVPESATSFVAYDAERMDTFRLSFEGEGAQRRIVTRNGQSAVRKE